MFDPYDTAPAEVWLPTWGTGLAGGLALPPGVDTIATIYAQIPQQWEHATASPWLIGSTGDLRLRLSTSILYQGAIYGTVTNPDEVHPAGIHTAPVGAPIDTPNPDTHYGRLLVQIARIGTDPSDTSPDPALLVGMLLTRT